MTDEIDFVRHFPVLQIQLSLVNVRVIKGCSVSSVDVVVRR